ncbi:MAG: response regulator [Desulfobacteraceae bacterium]|nr:response regulator [Desulfobacteraceae bacterium]
MSTVNPQKLSVVLGGFLCFTVLIFSVVILISTYNSASGLIDREMRNNFRQVQKISKQIIMREFDRIDNSLTTIQRNEALRSYHPGTGELNDAKHDTAIELIIALTESNPLDILFIAKRDNTIWINANSPFYGPEMDLSKIISRKKTLIHVGVIDCFAGHTTCLPALVKAVPLLSKDTGKVVGTLFGGIVLEHNLRLMQNIHEETDSSVVSFFINGRLIGATDHLDAETTKFLVVARQGAEGELSVENTDAGSGSPGLVSSWFPIEIHGKKTPLEIGSALPSTPFLKLKEVYVWKGIVLIFIIMLLPFITVIVIRKMTFKPLGNLLEYAEAVSSGNLVAEYQKGTIKEFNQLGAAMEKMVIGLKTSNTQLIMDLDRIKKAEKARVQSDERYQELFDNVPVGLFRSTARGRIVSVNSFHVKVFGFQSKKEILTSWSAESFYVDPKDRDRFLSHLRKHNSIKQFEVQLKKKDDSIFWGSLSARCHLDSSGKIQWIDGQVENITERKNSELEKAKLQTRLNQTHKMEALGTMAGGIAHDFNNILSAILGYSELSLADTPPGDTRYEFLEEILKAGIRARDLVKQILAFCRHGEHEMTPLELEPILTEALKLLRASIPSTIDIHMDITDCPPVNANATQIHQVIMNLTTNAAQAMNQDTGIISVSLREVDLDQAFTAKFEGLEPGAYTMLTVQDTGCGMTPETEIRAFDPFFTTKEKGSGTGMGLAVVHGIVQDHGGVITVYSEPGTGTTFNVYLPVLNAPLPPSSNDKTTAQHGSETVLFIDDERPVCIIGKRILESLGYDVLTTCSSRNALTMFKTEPEKYDLVITDLTMPKLTGKQLAKEITAIRPGIPVILCTGFNGGLTDQDARESGITAVVHKPLLTNELAETVRTSLDRHRIEAAPSLFL